MKKRYYLFSIIFVVFISLFILFWAPFLSGNRLGPIDWDWQWFYKYLSFIRESWRANRLPVFSYLMTPFLANGETSAFFPLSFLLKYYWVIDYIKINLAIHYLAGFFGLWMIFNKLMINKSLLIIAALISLFNGNIYAHFYIGHYGWITLLLLPLLYGLYLYKDDHWIYPISIGALVASTYYEGGQHVVIWYGMLLFILFVIEFLYDRKKAKFLLLNIGIIAGTTILFALAKLLPSQHLYHDYYNSNSVVLGGFESWRDLFVNLTTGIFKNTGGEHYKWTLMWWEQYSYIGQVVSLFFILYLIKPLQKRSREEVSLLAVAFVFLISSYNQVWYYLAKILPVSVILSQRHPSRLVVVFIFALSILVSIWLNRVMKLIENKSLQIIVIAATTIFLATDYILVNHENFKYNAKNYTYSELDEQYNASIQPNFIISDPSVASISQKIDPITNSMHLEVNAGSNFRMTFNSLMVFHHKVNLIATSDDGEIFNQIDSNNNPAFDLPAGRYNLKIHDNSYNNKIIILISIGSFFAYLLLLVILQINKIYRIKIDRMK